MKLSQNKLRINPPSSFKRKTCINFPVNNLGFTKKYEKWSEYTLFVGK